MTQPHKLIQIMNEEPTKGIMTEPIQGAPGWYYGEVDDYIINAQVYDDNSIWGIDNGRVVTLFVYNSKDNVKPVMDYQRGWEISPRGRKLEALLDRILDHLESLPESS